MSNCKVLILLMMALLSVAVASSSCMDEGDDPAVQMLQQQTPPASTTSAADVTTPDDGAEATEAEPVEGAEAEVGEGDESEAVEGVEAEPAAGGDGGEATEEEPAEGENEEAAPAGDESAEGDVVAEGEAGAEEEVLDDTEAVEEEEEAVSDDPIENFKALDPRDIIIKKYEDLESRKTTPWDETDPKEYIFDTGRPDPLSLVLDSVPDELKPDRAGDTDMNEINDYLVADEATRIVRIYAAIISCHNVVQIGLEKYVSLSIGGGPQFSVQEGFSTGGTAGNANGIPIVLTITVTSVATDQVVIRLTAAGQGTTTSISKTQVYIPSNVF
jgi:hypothetical protein